MTPRRTTFSTLRLLPLVLGALVIVLLLLVVGPKRSSSGATHRVSLSASLLAGNPNLDPGEHLYGRPAPNFTLRDQFGHRISLRQFRGKVVLLDFNDAECTTICPLTSQAMLEAKRLLGPAGADVQLLGIDANPRATSIHDVLSYSELHGMTDAWHFLTASRRVLKRVWSRYGIGVDIQRGLIDHTPALFVIDRRGGLQRLYITQQSYAAVPQLAQIVAQEMATLLPGHPHVASKLSLGEITGISPAQSTTVPRVGGGTLHLGPAHGAHLYVFFDTWDREVTPLASDLEALRRYVSAAASPRAGLPALTAIDEASVEPSTAALPRFLRTLPRALDFPVGLDRSGRLGDGYEVQDEPWFVLTSGTGQILWSWDASTNGWPSTARIEHYARAALTKAPRVSGAALAGSPAPLAALHAQASQLLGGGESALAARIRSLHGYPIVINVWASWCEPCQQEFGLFAQASQRYGAKVAFLGVDYNDETGNARSFLAGHRVDYPSYPVSVSDIDRLLPGGIEGTPTTVYIGPGGKIRYVRPREYTSSGTLDADIAQYALGQG